MRSRSSEVVIVKVDGAADAAAPAERGEEGPEAVDGSVPLGTCSWATAGRVVSKSAAKSIDRLIVIFHAGE
jgi:hypothetical protein